MDSLETKPKQSHKTC